MSRMSAIAALKLPSFRNLNPNTFTFNSQGAAVVGLRELESLGLRGDIQILENLGISNYNSLQAKLERRFSKGLTLLAAYTYGKALTDSVDHLSTSGAGNGVDVGAFKEPQDGNAAARVRAVGVRRDASLRALGRVATAVRHGQTNGTNWSPVADLLLGGWEFSPIFTAQTGLPLTIIQSDAFSIGGERRSRPNRIANGALPEASAPSTAGSIRTLSSPALLRGSWLCSQPDLRQFRSRHRARSGLVNLDFNLAKDFPSRSAFRRSSEPSSSTP